MYVFDENRCTEKATITEWRPENGVKSGRKMNTEGEKVKKKNHRSISGTKDGDRRGRGTDYEGIRHVEKGFRKSAG